MKYYQLKPISSNFKGAARWSSVEKISGVRWQEKLLKGRHKEKKGRAWAAKMFARSSRKDVYRTIVEGSRPAAGKKIERTSAEKHFAWTSAGKKLGRSSRKNVE